MARALRRGTPGGTGGSPTGGSPQFIVPTLLAVSIFGPYITAGLRTEQFAVYGLAIIVLPALIRRLGVPGGARFVVPWALYIIVACIGALFPLGQLSPWRPGNLLAGFDNIVAPLLVMLLIFAAVRPGEGERALLRVAKILAVGMAVNGAIAIVGTRVNLSGLLQPFWTSAATGGSVAELAAQLGRLGGIFNQPAEAGSLYGIAGLGAVLAWRHRPMLLIPLIVLISVGGLLTVSKIFIFAGLPAIVVYWVLVQSGPRRLGAFLGLGLLGLGVLQSGVFDQWIGANYLLRFLSDRGPLIDLLGAGRFNEESSFSLVVAAALELSPVIGVGAAGWAAPYDGFIAEALATGGLLGLALVALAVAAIFTLAPRSGRFLFTTLFGVVIVAGAFGFSPLTANRVSTAAWLVIALLVMARRDDLAAVTSPAQALSTPRPRRVMSRRARLAPAV